MVDARRLRRFPAPGPLLAGTEVVLGPEASRHMVTVLRTVRGDLVRVFDGQGHEFAAEVLEADPRAARLRVVEACGTPPAPAAHVVVAFAPPPGQRADVLLEKCTELGASAFQLVICDRSQDYRARAAANRVDRWRRKVADAARQAQRSVVPAVHEPLPFDEFVRRPACGLALIGLPDAADGLYRILEAEAARPERVTLAVGPAGGFTRREEGLAHDAGFRAVRLVPHVLRVETAALCMVAGVCLWLADAGNRPSG